MNLDDFIKYWIPACTNLFGEHDVGGVGFRIDFYTKLDRALDVELYTRFWCRASRRDKPLDENTRNLLVKLAGPHGRTILRAYQIQHGIENHEY